MLGLFTFMKKTETTRINTITDYYEMYLEQRREGNKKRLTIDENEVFIKDIFLDDTQEKLICTVRFSNGTEFLIKEEQDRPR